MPCWIFRQNESTPLNADSVNIRDPHSVITVPVDIILPDGPWQPMGIALIQLLEAILFNILWLIFIIRNGQEDLHIFQGPLLLTWINFNPSMDK